jgi:hypothetical protein
LAAIIVLMWSVQYTRAGAIRYARKQVQKGSIAAVQKTSDAAGTATGAFGDAGKAARAALKDGTAALRKDAAAAPGRAVRGTKAATSKIWKAVW